MSKYPFPALTLWLFLVYIGFSFGSNTSLAATAHILGRVVNENGSPVSGLRVTADDFFDDPILASTDTNGCYDLGVFANTWKVSVEPIDLLEKSLIASSLPLYDITDNTTNAGVDLVVRSITGAIVGRVYDTNNQGISFVMLGCGATMDGFFYPLSVVTDSLGYYELKVCNGSWDVDTLNLNPSGYVTPASQQTVILNNTNALNFVAIPLPPLQITTLQIPNALVGKPYSFQIEAVGGWPLYQWNVSTGSLPPGLSLDVYGVISGTPTKSTNAFFTTLLMDNAGTTIEKTFSLAAAFPFSLTMALKSPTKNLEIKLVGETNRSYILEYSFQMCGTNWTPAFTNQAINGMTLFTNLPRADSQRFYRARQN